MEYSRNEIKLLMVEDVPLYQRGTLGMLQDAGYVQVEAVSCVSEARAALKGKPYDFVIVDLRVPLYMGEPDLEKYGIDLVDDIKASNIAQIVLSRHLVQNNIAQVVARGIGFLSKDEIPNYLLLDYAIQATLQGAVVYSSTPHALLRALATKPNPRSDPNRTTRREREAIYLFVFKHGGKSGSDEAVAEAMVIASQTAREHRRNFMAKLDLHSQAEVVNWAHRHPQEFEDVRELYKHIPDAG